MQLGFRISALFFSIVAATVRCTWGADERTFVFSIDLFEGASGYFLVKGHDGVQPDLTMVR